ncbi:MAG TPA: protein-disulfide reductase DsbD domain-containing protein [Thermoanaerobaculia bacterium]|jgi:DsbC/DsbD-like thiol-disulfide interchange protein
MNAPKTALLSAAVATVLLAPAPARGAAGEWSKNPQSSVRLITPWRVAPRSGELFLGLHFRLAPGWHVYWKNSGDAGFPPSVAFQPAKVLGKPDLLWPTPHRFDLPGGLVAFGYEKEVVYPVRATIKPGASLEDGEPLPITADLDYLVCEVDCIPYHYTLSVDQPVGDPPANDPETVPLLKAWLDRLPRLPREVPGLQVGAGLDASRPGQPPALEIRLRGVTGQAGKTDVFLEPHEALDAGRPRVRVFPDRVNLHVPLKVREAGKALPAKVALAWTVSNLATTDGKGFDLEVRQEVPVWTAPVEKPVKTPVLAPDPLPRLLLWALLGGMLLNLAPTVLALLTGEAFALRGAETGVRERAAAAATGVVGACWGLAALALAVHRRGLPAGWGAALQEPTLGALLAVAAAVLTLNLWGLLEAPLAPAGSSRTGTGRHLLAGLFTAPLALAWPVPLVQEPVGYAFGRGPAAVCAVYAVVGFGLALPYLVLILAPAAVRRLPAPGPWLARLREGLGFLAGASTLWLLYALSRQVSPEGLAWIELALLGMGLLAWLRAREGAGRALRLALVLGLAACAAGALWSADRNRLVPRSAATKTHETNSERLPRTLRAPIPNQTSGG